MPLDELPVLRVLCQSIRVRDPLHGPGAGPRSFPTRRSMGQVGGQNLPEDIVDEPISPPHDLRPRNLWVPVAFIRWHVRCRLRHYKHLLGKVKLHSRTAALAHRDVRSPGRCGDIILKLLSYIYLWRLCNWKPGAGVYCLMRPPTAKTNYLAAHQIARP